VKRFLTPLAAATLALAPGLFAADLGRPARFGALEVASADSARSQAAAWLKEAGKSDPATQARFDEIWKSDAPVLDKVSRTLELGDAAAAKLLAATRDTGTAAPTELPPLLKDAKSSFFKNNLALAYARLLCNRSVHEEALAVLNLTRPEQVVDPAAYLFHRALSEHALLDKNAAVGSINRLLDDVNGAPERYRTLAALMALDMHTWSEKDLDSIARKMRNVERRLDLSRGGPKTQKIQKEIVSRLDEMIKELENQCKSGNCNGGACPNGGSAPGGGANPSAPMPDSNIAKNGGTGVVDQAKLRKLVEQWGNLPPREQARALQDLTQGMSPRHREAIENYFRNLAVAQSRK